MMETPSGDFPNLINALLYMPPHAIITLLSIIVSYFPYFLAFLCKPKPQFVHERIKLAATAKSEIGPISNSL